MGVVGHYQRWQSSVISVIFALLAFCFPPGLSPNLATWPAECKVPYITENSHHWSLHSFLFSKVTCVVEGPNWFFPFKDKMPNSSGRASFHRSSLAGHSNRFHPTVGSLYAPDPDCGLGNPSWQWNTKGENGYKPQGTAAVLALRW